MTKTIRASSQMANAQTGRDSVAQYPTGISRHCNNGDA